MALPALAPLLHRAAARGLLKHLGRLAPAPPGKGPLIAAGAAIIAVPLLVLVVLLGGGVVSPGCAQADGLSGPAALSEHAKRAIPPKFIPIYVAAAQRYRLGAQGWAYLASIGYTENKFADSGGSPTSTAGALGPMQFLPSTWAIYGADGNGDGKKDPQNLHDAIFGAANYLRASGAPGDWQRALFAYNHAQWYVDRVQALALDYLGDGPATQYASETSSGCTCAPGAGETIPAVDGGATGPLPGGVPELRWPSSERSISSPYGLRWGRLHAGIDIPMAIGTPLHAAAAGRVTEASYFSGYGNYTCIQHATAFTTCYAHQDQLQVRPGQTVAAGQVIGRSGNTGGSTGPHLHFEVRRGAGFAGTPVDPAPYLQGAPGPGPGATTPAGAGAGCSPDTQLAALEGGSLLWPTTRRGEVIGRPYTGTHTLGNWQSDNAIDIAVPARTPIVAVDSGRICSGCGFGGPAGTGSGRFDGARLTLNTASGNQVFYAHLKRLARGVRPGARVERGQVIAWSWMANGVPHLHIGVRDGNPLQLFGVDTATPARAA